MRPSLSSISRSMLAGHSAWCVSTAPTTNRFLIPAEKVGVSQTTPQCDEQPGSRICLERDGCSACLLIHKQQRKHAPGKLGTLLFQSQKVLKCGLVVGPARRIFLWQRQAPTCQRAPATENAASTRR